jgi:hypothetical protein
MVAGDGGVVAEDFVLKDVLPRLDCVEEVGDVVGGIVVVLGRRVTFHFAQHRRARAQAHKIPPCHR